MRTHDEIIAEAQRRHPHNHTVDDPFGETGEAQSDPYGYEETARLAFIAGGAFALEGEPAPAKGDEREALTRDTMIESVKLDARNSMRHDPHVWHEALETALDKTLPAFWAAAAGFRRPSTPTDKEILRERSRQIEKGYDAAHDDEHGLDHLLFWAQRYGMEGKHLESLALVQAAREYLPRHQPSTPTEEDVKRAARAIWRGYVGPNESGFDKPTFAHDREKALAVARAALSAVHPEVTQ
jgi:hypothetical protein